MKLDEREAYLAMFEFLVVIYERAKSDELGALLGSMSLLEDEVTADPAVWEDWVRCIDKVKQDNIDPSLGISS